MACRHLHTTKYRDSWWTFDTSGTNGDDFGIFVRSRVPNVRCQNHGYISANCIQICYRYFRTNICSARNVDNISRDKYRYAYRQATMVSQIGIS